MVSVPDRTNITNPVLERTLLVALVSLGMGALFDLLFFGKLPGISFPLYVALTLSVSLWWASMQHRKVPRTALYMIPLLLFFSAMVFVRAGELLTFFNTVISLYLLLLFVNLVFIPDLLRYKFRDYLAFIFRLPLQVLRKAREALAPAARQNGFIAKHQVFPQVVRGVLITVPVLVLFVILFSSADLVFRQYVAGLFSFEFNIELFWRAFWLLAVAVVFLGLFGLFGHREETARTHQEHSAWAGQGRHGLVEASVLFGSLNALFLIFIFVQLTYLFGGASNVVGGEFTYAEYARKGFFELIAVAGLSFLLIFAAERLLLREGQKHAPQFKLLSGALIVQVLIVMLSAFKRLQLYEGAYGYTSLRVYSHIFIIWLAVVFVALLYKIFADKRESVLAFSMFVGVMALFVSFNFINVDGLVARKNIERYQTTGKLDLRYINSLSDDAIVGVAGLLNSEDERLRAVVASHLYQRQQFLLAHDGSWQSANVTRKSALRVLNEKRDVLEQNKDKIIEPGYLGPGH